MSAERLHESLRELHATADRLETGAAAPETAARTAAIAAVYPVQDERGPRRSTRRIVLFTVAHTAATVALLVAVSATVDPLLPRPARPQLGEPLPALVDDGGGRDIPLHTANGP